MSDKLPSAEQPQSPIQPARTDRRKFLTGLALGAGLAPLTTMFGQRTSAGRAASLANDLCYNPTKAVLGAQDLSYLGYYDVQLSGNNTTYGQALTHRYVNGELRFLTVEHPGWLAEFTIAGSGYGQVITNTTNRWNSPGGLGDFTGIWWEEAQQRLWTMSATDYNANFIQGRIFTRTLNANGSIANLRGPVGLSGIPDKRLYGGALALPAWFQSAYGVGPYAVGWGGYTSLMAQGGSASLGPAMYAIPDPSGYGDNTEIPTSGYKTAMDCVSATTHSDWYGSGSPTSFDRGVRLTNPTNYFDGGDSRQNPSTPPTVAPSAGAGWLSPAPDGRGRLVWGDSYYNTGVWIDGPSKHGFLLVASLGGGRVWYQQSTLHFDRREFEVHIFNPDDIGQAIRGQRAPWNVKPSSMQQLSLAGLGSATFNGNSNVENAGSATYDAVGKRLYIMGRGINTFYARLYTYAVNA
jgi:hypothetical protein